MAPSPSPLQKSKSSSSPLKGRPASLERSVSTTGSAAQGIMFARRMSVRVRKPAKQKSAKELAQEWSKKKAADMARFKPRPSGKLSNEELTVAKRVFATIDVDHSGYIDMEELLSWFRSSGKALTREEALDFMCGADTSSDGKIDLREFLDVFFNALSSDTQKEEAVDSFKHLLEEHGESGQQKIRKADLLNILNEHYGLEVDATYVDNLMKEAWMNSGRGSVADLDDSLDDFITLDELRRALDV